MKRLVLITGLLIFALSACGSPAAVTEAPPPAEETAPAVETALPTEAPEATAEPEPVLFRDEFAGAIDPAWSWLNEDPARWAITPEGWLQIQAAHPGFLAGDDGESRQVNLLTMPAPQGSFMITTRLYAAPDENFQQAGIFMIHDGENYVSILNAFCAPCLPDSGGFGFFMEAFKNKEYAANGMLQGHSADLTDAYLRLVYSAEAGTVTGFVATQPDQWQQLGVIEGFPSVEQIGVGAANAPSPEGIQEDLAAYYAYVEVSTVDTPVISSDPLPALPEPTATPTPTSTPEPTPLPEGMLFRDDFEGYLQPGWSWVNENPDQWAFAEGGWLEITGGDRAFYHEGNLGIENFLTRELPDGEFMISAHVQANPNENFQQATIFIFEDPENYMALNIGYCGPCQVNGSGFFMETFIDNNPFENAYMVSRDSAANDVYLRLVNQGGSISGYYATESGNWQKIGAFGNYFDFKLVGLGATNSNPNGVQNKIVARFDYFEISAPE